MVMENSQNCIQTPNSIIRKNISPDGMVPKSLVHNKINQTDSTGNSSGGSSIEYRTPNSIRARRAAFSTFPIVNTPTPPSRFKRIINPFELGLTERLHLPLIESPSLFHRPATPQLCSTQVEFEWTIDEVSSLNPANVEAHETQFTSVIDPEIEAKAQAAISSYFKEQIIVPSPDDCPFREQKIVLTNSLTKNRDGTLRTKRDGYCQTELTLPPILPKEIEDALKPFFTYTQEQQQTPVKDCDNILNTTNNMSMIDHDARDASLRRKLFQTYANVSEASSTEYERDILLDSPTPQTPELDLKNIRSKRFLTPKLCDNGTNENQSPLDISLSPVEKESFGCISPISKVTIATALSTQKYSQANINQNASRSSASSLYRSTPDRSSIFRSISANSIDMSLDRPTVTGTVITSNSCDMKRKSFHLSDERDMSSYGRSSSESNENDQNLSYEDIMQISQSSYGSQHHPHTPILNKSKRRRRSVNRKNLSLSFNSCQTDDNISMMDNHEGFMIQINENSSSGHANEVLANKTDSGFTEYDEFKKFNSTEKDSKSEHFQFQHEKSLNFSKLNMDVSMSINDSL